VPQSKTFQIIVRIQGKISVDIDMKNLLLALIRFIFVFANSGLNLP